VHGLGGDGAGQTDGDQIGPLSSFFQKNSLLFKHRFKVADSEP
jgi:hypothetical protein